MKKKASKAPVKQTAAKRISHSKKPVSPRKTVAAPKANREPARKAASAGGHKVLPESQKKLFRDLLLTMRERITGQIQALKGDSLQRHDEVNSAEDGTDAFERQFALNIVSTENDAVFEIDEALQRLEDGAYGVCEGEDCGELIETPRLKALPFVRKCIKCQSKSEAGRLKFRPMAAAVEEI